MRHCGGCTLCCKLVPVEELHKPAGTRCVHQRTGKGCAIYRSRPPSCRAWNCLWLIGSSGGHDLRLGRPDRTHYVLDMAPDMVRVRNATTGAIEDEFLCMQIWVDPLYPDAWQDPDLLDMLERDKVVALIRYGSSEAFAIFPPGRTTSGKWERSARQQSSNAGDLEEARLKARFQFWANAAKEQSLGTNDSEVTVGGNTGGEAGEAGERRAGRAGVHEPT